ncbi:autophagy-related protein 33 [Colletotrichum spaethianum]|uniref:Autophagy-related protein 33 n=1 Tax=Colletotrichum spaethianum TaxID=700344 RepID=A0AA37NV93_9PEZI|nr:autophagy-related protein 33 [Colletotrichum spaethianum]GKT40040.1 autophagy-related protein 33 [Colletotrichum spaethianum]
MASKGVSLLKFVGTVSLGLLTGLSYSLTTVTVPSILSLPSASDALRAFKNLYPGATARLRILTGVSATSFLLAFFLSPRAFRHPYLVYSSVLCLTSGLAEQITPYILKSSGSSKESIAARRQASREREEARKAARLARQEARMEASYEVLGDAHSDGAGSASGDDAAAAAAAEEEEEALNGEEVRSEVEGFRKTQLVQSAVASFGFLLSVIGIWGDGAIQVFQRETVIVGV